ncbi:MAG: hypothetical protein EZS28_030719 [Streblomastix strix]|uniref:Uncharacterized protein n=1 Tax=Streblomastix strix TaxID=222440 RepID=A0A5J4UTV7_9EUKA|nr:MAG: hypothetical protein EZS28_030719 [Streblomastix strix]
MNNSLSQQQIQTVRQLITNDIAYYIQYSKRGGSSGGMMQNDEYQLFIDNNNALVYTANNQIIDGMALDYALKIEPNGLLTIKNLKVINFDFVAQINYAESGTVWMFDANWYNSGDIVPDQVTPVSDALPIVDGTAAAGISTEYSRGDHVHPLNITTTIPVSDSASGSVGTANYYARSDHSHPLNISTTIPPQDSASGSVGTTSYYASNDHSHPINVETSASNIPIVDGVGANGSSAFYARQDHVHPQQLTYDGNVTATKFIKTGGTSNDILLADGSTKQSVLAGRSFTVIDPEQYVKLYTFIAVLITYGFYTLMLVSIDMENCALPTGYSSIQQLFPNSYGNIQVNSTTNQFSQGIRISRSTNTNQSGIFLGCDPLSTTGSLQDQQNIVNTTAGQFRIGVNDQITEANQGLTISADGQALTFNGNQFVDLTTDQSLSGIKTFHKLVQVIPSANGTFNEGIRISRHPANQWNNIQFGRDPNTNSGKIDNQWLVGSTGNNGANYFGFAIVKTGEEGQADRGLQISADGNTLSFNGQVIAGGSVNYSQSSTILWGTKSLGTDGGFYTNGTTVFWRDHALQFDPYYQG